MWKRILKIVVWLYAFTPVGIWMLWREERLSTTAKWRIFLYALVIPLLAYFAISLIGVNHALQKSGL